MGYPIPCIRTAKKTGSYLTAVLFALCIAFTGYGQSPTAQNGVLNLKNHSWVNDGIVSLNGEWEFYWQKFYTPDSFANNIIRPTDFAEVPGFWNSHLPNQHFFKPAFGYATYRLQVICPPTSRPLELKFLTIASSYILYVNGKQLARVGRPGKTKSSSIPAFQPIIVPVTPEDNKLDIVIQVSNFTYNEGGLWDVVKLGTGRQINAYRTKNVATDYFIAGSFFLMGLFYLVVYFFFSRRHSPLYFALFCFVIGIRPLVTGELGVYYFFNWDWQITKQVEFLSLYLMLPVMSLFSFELFPKEFSKKVLYVILAASVPFILITLFSSPFYFRYTLRAFQIFILVAAVYGLKVYITAALHKRNGSLTFLIGFGALFLAAINDILHTALVISTTNLLYAGLYVLVISQATTLSKQFFHAYTRVKKLARQLEQTNSELQVKNNVINEANEELNKLNAELDNMVFRTSHDLRSPITSVYAMADVIKMEDDKAQRDEYIDFQKKTIRRLDALINDILQYAKTKSTALQYEAIDMESYITTALQDHQFAYHSEKIARIVEVKQSCEFKTDKIRLNIILNNLFSNALKHHNRGQEHPFLKVVVQVTGQDARIEVADNGPGIAPHHLEHIFTRFYRVNTASNGSGFGLYIVKEMVEKLGGTITVHSEVGKGTQFFISIPNGVQHIGS